MEGEEGGSYLCDIFMSKVKRGPLNIFRILKNWHYVLNGNKVFQVFQFKIQNKPGILWGRCIQELLEDPKPYPSHTSPEFSVPQNY